MNYFFKLSMITILATLLWACGSNKKKADLMGFAPSNVAPLPVKITGCIRIPTIQLSYDSINRLSAYITRDKAGELIDSVGIYYGRDSVIMNGTLNNSKIEQGFKLDEDGKAISSLWRIGSKKEGEDHKFRYDFDNFLNTFTFQNSGVDENYTFEVVNNNIASFVCHAFNLNGTISYTNIQANSTIPIIWESIDIPYLYPALYADILGHKSFQLPQSINILNSSTKQVKEVITFSDYNFGPDGNVTSWITKKHIKIPNDTIIISKATVAYAPAH